MSRKLITVLKVFSLILMIVIIVTGMVEKLSSKNVLSKFEDEINMNDTEKMSLAIYFMKPYTLTLYPLSAEDLIHMNSESDVYEDGVINITISGRDLDKVSDLLKNINEDTLTAVETHSRMNARIFYVFKNQKGEELLDVVMWGATDSIFVNGEEYLENNIFYEILAEELALALMKNGPIPSKNPEDALHIAVATVNGIDYILTWNFAHIIWLIHKLYK